MKKEFKDFKENNKKRIKRKILCVYYQEIISVWEVERIKLKYKCNQVYLKLEIHTPTVLSSDPDAKYSPFGENTTLLTQSLWPVRVWMRSSLDTLHNPISLKDPDAKYSPFGENTTLLTQSECPVKVLIRSPLGTLHTPIVLSSDPDAKYSPFGEKTKLLTHDECPVRVFIYSPSDTLHNLIFLSVDPDAKYSPFGENTTLLT